MFGLGAQEMLVILAIGVLLFGRKLPDLGRSLGKGIVEFKKGLQGIEDEVHDAASRPPSFPASEPVTGAPAS